MIILQDTDADQVRGQTTAGHALAPRPLNDGTFALPDACKTDPFHSDHAAFLATLPMVADNTINPGTQADINSPIVGSDWMQPDSDIHISILSANTYSSDWSVGMPVSISVAGGVATKTVGATLSPSPPTRLPPV
jgi:hypothetical protein